MDNSNNSSNNAFILLPDDNIGLFIEGKNHTISDSHPSFEAIKDELKTSGEIDWSAIEELVDVATTVERFGQGSVTVEHGAVFYKGEEVNGVLVDRILRMIGEGYNVTPLCNFLANLEENPSFQARKELYMFLEASNMPITPDGYFLAYKAVAENFKDKWEGIFDNSVGAVCEMPRSKVDDNRENTCSRGLHFATHKYVTQCYGSHGDRIMAIKINPRDVVSIPNDYNNEKGRCCRYEVVEHLGDILDSKNRVEDTLTQRVVNADYDGAYVEEKRDTRENHKHQTRDAWGRFVRGFKSER
jgi:hypothetical protein